MLLLQQLQAMLTKRFINSKRYKKGIITQLVLPIVFAILGKSISDVFSALQNPLHYQYSTAFSVYNLNLRRFVFTLLSTIYFPASALLFMHSNFQWNVPPLNSTTPGLAVVKVAPSQGSELSRAISLRNYPGKGLDGTVFFADLTEENLTKSYFHVTIYWPDSCCFAFLRSQTVFHR